MPTRRLSGWRGAAAALRAGIAERGPVASAGAREWLVLATGLTDALDAGQSEAGPPANAFISANPRRMDRVVPGGATAPDDR